jgi:hypothetical protein
VRLQSVEQHSHTAPTPTHLHIHPRYAPRPPATTPRLRYGHVIISHRGLGLYDPRVLHAVAGRDPMIPTTVC